MSMLGSTGLGRAMSVALIVALALGVNVAPVVAINSPDTAGEARTIPPSSEPTVTVVRELPERRTETSKHYLLSDGSQRAEISGAPVHFKDSVGRWQQIDTSLEAIAPSTYRTRSTSISAEFAPDAAFGPPATLKTDDWSVGIDYLGGADKTPFVAGDEARYLDVAAGADLIYQPLEDGIKERVVLDSPDSANTFTFKLTTDGVELRRLPIGGYALVSSTTGEVESVMGTLEVYDSTSPEPVRCDTATMTVTATTDGALVTCEVPREWLADPTRVFPVTVDPTFTTLFDTYVCSGKPNSSFGTDTSLLVGRWGPTNGYYRSYTYFDVSSITTSSEVYAATYSAYLYSAADTLSRATRLGRLNAPFTEATTWGNKPGYNYLDIQSVAGYNKWVSWNVKSSVQAWISGSTPNYGLQMYQAEDGSQDSGAGRYFYSSEYSDGGKRPKLVIDYNSLPDDIRSLAVDSTNTGLDWWRASTPTAADDLPKAGRGNVTLSWPRPARSEGYHVWMYDGGTYRQVANIADPRTTTWSTEDAQLYPSDTEINGWGADSQTNPFAAAASPSHSSVVTTATRDITGPGNTGVIATDGTYLYLHQYGATGRWWKVGNGIESTTPAVEIGPSVTAARTGFYLDGFLFGGYATSPTTMEGIWAGASLDETNTNTITFSKPLLSRGGGGEITGPSGEVLLATDGEYLYSGACKMIGDKRDGYRIRVYDRNGTWIADHDVPMVAYTPGTMFTDGESIYFVRWAGNSNDTDVDKISLDTFRHVNRYNILQIAGSLIGATYDRANDCFFGGTLYDDKVYRFKGPGLDLRDNPNTLYQKTPGEDYDNGVNYWFRVTAYNSTGETSKFDCPAYTPILPNRSITAVDDPRHTAEDLGEFAGHSMSAVLDKSRLQVEAEDLSLASYGPQASLSRVYRSDDASSHGFAPGWRFSFDQSIESSGSAMKTWIDEAGERHTFSYDTTSAVWIAPPGLAASLTVNGAGGTIETVDHTRYEFDAFTGVLASVTDRQGDKTSYDYSVADDVTIIAANGRTITVDRDASSAVLSATDGVRTIIYETSGTPSVTRFAGSPEAVTVEYDYVASRLAGIAVPGYPSAGDRSAFTFTYDGFGRLSEVRQPGYDNDSTKKTTVSYSSSGASIARTGAVSGAPQTITNSYTWNPNGTTASKTDAKVSGEANATWTYCYAPNNELMDTFSPTGAQTHRVVDADGRLLYDYDEAGHRSAYYYNDSGDCVREVDPRGCTTYRSFDTSGNLTREERVLTADGERAVTTWSGYAHGLAGSESRRVSATETYTVEYLYDISGQVATQTAKAVKFHPTGLYYDIVAKKYYDASGNLILEYDYAGSLVTSTTYDAAGRAVASEDASGVITTQRYDVLGNEIESFRSHPATSTKADWATKSYDAMGRLTAEAYILHRSDGTTQTQTTVSHTYDAMGRETTTDDAVIDGREAKSEYDARGNVTRSWNEGVPAYDEDRSNRTDFDVYGRQVTTYEPGTTTVASTFTYYPDGEVKRESRADGSWTEYVYDEGGNKIAELTPSDDGAATATFAYDVGGRLTAETDADGATITHTYDLIGRETNATGEGPSSTTVYNAFSNVISATDADGVKTDSTFNASGQGTKVVVTQAGGGANRTTTTAYDRTGRVLSTTDPDGREIAYDYDVFGRATRERHTTSAGLIKDEARVFDSLGRATSTFDVKTGVERSFTYPQGSTGETTVRTEYAGIVTTTTVGADGREVSRVSDLLGVSLTRSSLGSDTAGRETGWSVGATEHSRTFNGAGQLTAWSAGTGTTAALGYNEAARKDHDMLSTSLLASLEQTYTYTDDGRLATLVSTSGGTTSYGFDAAGNLTTETAGAVTSMSYDADTQRLVNRKVGASIVATYTFDKFGQREYQGPLANEYETHFTYTGTGRLASYATSSGVSADYLYDASGQRTASIVRDASVVTTTTYTYEGLNLLSLTALRSDGATWSVGYLYDGEGRPYAGVYASGVATRTVFQLVTTDRGDVVELLDASGEPFAAYRYDVWGLPTASTSTTTTIIPSATLAADIASRQPLRYAGYCFDEHSGLYYLSARTYDPVTRQFLSKDPAKDDGEESQYQYCSGEPVLRTDAAGLWWQLSRIRFSRQAAVDYCNMRRAPSQLWEIAAVLIEWLYPPAAPILFAGTACIHFASFSSFSNLPSDAGKGDLWRVEASDVWRITSKSRRSGHERKYRLDLRVKVYQDGRYRQTAYGSVYSWTNQKTRIEGGYWGFPDWYRSKPSNYRTPRDRWLKRFWDL